MSITAPILKLLAAGIIAVGIGAAALGAEDDARQITAAESMEAVMWGRGTIGGPFSLTDHTGRPRTDADFRGKLLLVYFGFTHCPDICPTDLMAVAGALNSLGAQADEVRALFISLDPQRDTQALLSTYRTVHPARRERLQGLFRESAREEYRRLRHRSHRLYLSDGPRRQICRRASALDVVRPHRTGAEAATGALIGCRPSLRALQSITRLEYFPPPSQQVSFLPNQL